MVPYNNCFILGTHILVVLHINVSFFLSLDDKNWDCVAPLAMSVNIVENCFLAQHQGFQCETCLRDGWDESHL